MSEQRHLEIHRNGGVVEVVIHRPECLNALNSSLINEMTRTFMELGSDERCRVIILTGAGTKAFVAGADIKEMVEMRPLEARDFAVRGQGLIHAVRDCGKPVIAAVNGYALGGGLELALACSFVYASENAVLGLPETSLGLLPSFGGTQNLPRAVGEARARELILSGRRLSAREALEWGLVNRVVPAEELLSAVRAAAAAILEQDGQAQSLALEVVNRATSLPLEEGLRLESSLFGLLFSTQASRERMGRFIQKK